MKQEEIEKQAEEYGYAEAQKLLKINEDCHTHFSFNRADISKAFQDGAKWGIEHAIEWHRLEENPSDLPEVKGYYFVVTKNCPEGIKSYYNHSEMEFNDCGVIAWCELPQFKE